MSFTDPPADVWGKNDWRLVPAPEGYDDGKWKPEKVGKVTPYGHIYASAPGRAWSSGVIMISKSELPAALAAGWKKRRSAGPFVEVEKEYVSVGIANPGSDPDDPDHGSEEG